MLSIVRKYFKNKSLSKINIGHNVYIDDTVDIFAPHLVTIADNVHIQFGCKFFADGGV